MLYYFNNSFLVSPNNAILSLEPLFNYTSWSVVFYKFGICNVDTLGLLHERIIVDNITDIF